MSELAACINGPRCPGWDGRNAQPASDPYCRECLDRAERDIRGLIYDYVDLAQLHEASLSQAPNEHTSGGGHESPTLLAEHVEALQAEIVYVTALWEHALRADGRLSNPRTFAPLWSNTVYDRINLTTGSTGLRRARPGHIVQRAIAIITGRIDRLARLQPVTVCPTGIEDHPVRMAGFEAIEQLQQLHQRARGILGRTTRRFWIPGECWTCPARPVQGVDGPLWRSEPKRAEDPIEVHCGTCGACRPYPDYEHYQQHLLWPDQPTDALVRTAA